jgi:hypothetical protein
MLERISNRLLMVYQHGLTINTGQPLRWLQRRLFFFTHTCQRVNLCTRCNFVRLSIELA